MSSPFSTGSSNLKPNDSSMNASSTVDKIGKIGDGSAPVPPASDSAMTSSSPSSPFPIRPYRPRNPSGEFPYSASDFVRSDESSDEGFYASPRYVTHIDDHAIGVLKNYYAAVLPRKGRILDLCSSWISHFPRELEQRARRGVEATRRQGGEKSLPEAGKRESGQAQRQLAEEGQAASSSAPAPMIEEEEESLEVIGLGLSGPELAQNPILSHRIIQDLNSQPTISLSNPISSSPSSSSTSNTNSKPTAQLNSTTCVVSIDYLTSPLSVLTSILSHTVSGGTIHLVISNRCFPTKAISRWLRISEKQRLDMVGDYLWWSGWKDIEIVELSDGTPSPVERDGTTGQEDSNGGMLKGGLEELFRAVGLGAARVDPLWVVRARKV